MALIHDCNVFLYQTLPEIKEANRNHKEHPWMFVVGVAIDQVRKCEAAGWQFEPIDTWITEFLTWI